MLVARRLRGEPAELAWRRYADRLIRAYTHFTGFTVPTHLRIELHISDAELYDRGKMIFNGDRIFTRTEDGDWDWRRIRKAIRQQQHGLANRLEVAAEIKKAGQRA